MKTPHKHAEQIHAWADGAKIQWEDVTGKWWDCVGTPSWYVGTVFSVKPEPLRYRSALVKAVPGGPYFVSTMTEGVDAHDISEWPGFIQWLGDWHEVEEAAPRNKYPDLSTEGEN